MTTAYAHLAATFADWMNDAVCEPDSAWTTNKAPAARVLSALQTVCSRCPVQLECARYALALNLDGGVYAGVYIPGKLNEQQRRTLGYTAARHALQRKVIQLQKTERHV